MFSLFATSVVANSRAGGRAAASFDNGALVCALLPVYGPYYLFTTRAPLRAPRMFISFAALFLPPFIVDAFT